ncbi:hypothetical protein E4T38_08931 [Aureobasidium subglaciale]|nr:hypothetical protein E4T38_08931 [Aureobasidium subglaciale]KAI5214595.1 hypothetical protein E4T40_08923 [Aureobasidium subglaciale]KAI5217379.1 hypothetical protein E4T41_08882 [Aureobasidium subglaciale]KAI5255041.1 hypothetical protein E4T46_08916 [Aureobasidium subglaciale]
MYFSLQQYNNRSQVADSRDLANILEPSQSKMTLDTDTMSMEDLASVVARENVIGHSQNTFDLLARSPKGYMSNFRLVLAMMQVLYDQGHYRHLQTLIVGLTGSEEWSTKENQIATLLKYVTLDSTYADASNEFTKARLVQDVQQALHEVEYSVAKLEDVNLTSWSIPGLLLLRLSYPQHKVWERCGVNEDLGVLGGIKLTFLIKYLLDQGYYWEAEHILPIFFREYKTESNQTELECIYSAIEVFLSRVDMSDRRQTWAQAAMLQTYLEGCIRVTSWASHIGSWKAFWQPKELHLDELISEVRGKYGEETWLSSRSRIRYDLMCIDLKVWNELSRGSSRNYENSPSKKEALRTLFKLKELAARNRDNRSQASVQWRLEMLANFADPHVITGTADLVSVPKHIYELRHGILTRQDHDLQRHWLVRSQGTIHKLDYWRLENDYESILENHRSTVVLLGRSGTGKSTLFRTMTGKYAAIPEAVPYASDLREEACMTQNGSVLRIVDTPGLGDQDEENFEIWKQICETLRRETKSKQKGSYVVYLIDVSSNEMNKADLKHMQALKLLVGDENWSKVSIVFTRGTTSGEDDLDWRKKIETDLMEKYKRLIFGETKKDNADIVLLNLDYTDKEVLKSETEKMPGIDSGESTVGAKTTEDARAMSPSSYKDHQNRAATPPPSYDDNKNGTVTKLPPPHEQPESNKASVPPPSYESLQNSAVAIPKRHIYRPANFDQVDRLISRVLAQQSSDPFMSQHEMGVENWTFESTKIGRYLKLLRPWEPSYASQQTSVYSF